MLGDSEGLREASRKATTISRRIFTTREEKGKVFFDYSLDGEASIVP